MSPAKKQTPRRPRQPSATVYAIKRGALWQSDGAIPWSRYFAQARLYHYRPLAYRGCIVVPCRVRVLPSVKRNRTRTR